MEKTEVLKFAHIPVLARELIAGLNLKQGGHYLDATVGCGGHSDLILSSFADIKLTAIDRDDIALEAAKNKLLIYEQQIEFWQGNFADYQPGDRLFDGIIADLGVSSPQLDLPERGFSFRQSGNLDMRMDRNQSLNAASIINYWQEKQLADIFYQYGEERLSRRIAKYIVEKRPFQTTTQLANAISICVPSSYRYGRIHPATRVFQALRIVVNQELVSLENFLAKAPYWLKPGGIIGIISFHSLEDRLVKHKFKDLEILQVISKKPIVAQVEEERKNPRSRSAKLRLARRIEDL